MAIKNVVLIGAGGNIGPYILKSLDKAGFNVTILSRQSSSSKFPDHKVVKVSDSYPHSELVAAFKGQDAIVSTFTSTGAGKLIAGTGEGQEKFIDAAIEAGVPRFIPSEYGGDNRNAAAVEISPIYADKLKIIKYLQARQDKISWTAVITGPFFEFGFKVNFFDINVKEGKAKITDSGNNKWSTTTQSQIGEGVAAILKHDKETANKYVTLESFLVSQNELVAALEKQGHKLEIENQDGQGLIKGATAGYNAGNLFAAYGLIQATNFIPGYGPDLSAESAQWRSVLGLEKLDVQTELKRVLGEIGA